MDQSNRLFRRCQRPRPYDLRRKVLLKNFLKEQMTYLPQVNETELSSETSTNDVNGIHDSTSLPENRQNSAEETDHDHTSNGNTGSQISQNLDSAETVVSSDSSKENVLSSDGLPFVEISASSSKTSGSKACRISSFMKLRSSTIKSKNNSILKAKLSGKIVKSPVKEVSYKLRLSRIFNGHVSDMEKNPLSMCDSDKKSDKSLAWRLFRPLKQSKKSRKRKVLRRQSNSFDKQAKAIEKANEACSGMTSQSVQTDSTWSIENISHLEQTNKLLREENRLLIESLSYFMTDTDISPRKRMREDIFEDPYDHMSSSSTILEEDNKCDWFSFTETRKSKRPNLRDKKDGTLKKIPKCSKVLRSKSVQERTDRKTLSRNCHRTQSMHVSNKNNFLNEANLSTFSNHKAPSFYSQNMMMNSSHFNDSSISIPRVKTPILRSLPVSSSNHQIQRRSSMPERTCPEKRSSKRCRRSGSVREYSTNAHTPFQDLPAEAFY